MAISSLKAVVFASAWTWIASPVRAQCLELQPGFRVPGPSDRVQALASADLGSGSRLFAGGAFTDVEGSPAAHVAVWDGEIWSQLGAGVDGDVLALCSTSALSGPRLFAGGRFTSAGGSTAARIAAWDGSAWAALASGVDDAVRAIAVFDDGSGPALYVGGDFAAAGGAPASHVARWDGGAWSSLGAGLDGPVNALCVFDDGSGAALYAGGNFVQDAGAGAKNVARWTGTAWAAVGAGLDCAVATLAAFDSAGGPRLCAGGCGVQAWDGAAWSELGAGSPSALSLLVFDGGSGAVLHAGDFSRTYAFDGALWNALPSLSDASPVLALCAHDDGAGTSLYAAGEVLYSPIAFPLYLARFDGARWIPVGATLGTNDGVRALIGFDDGGGEALYAAGLFTTAGSTPANRIARLDGNRWSALDGGGIGGPVRGSDRVQALASYDDGSGPALYAAGKFSLAGGSPANGIARWKASAWSPLGSGLSGGSFPVAQAMTTFDDGSGTRLYVGGSFTGAGGTPVSNLAAWDGATWSDVGGGLDGEASCLIVFDDGSGPALYVGGDFTHAGGVATDGVAKWDGSAWSSRSLVTDILALAVHDDGTGPALYAGGALDFLLHRWNGSGWTSIPAVGFDPTVTALASFDDGSGPELFAAPGLLTKGPPSTYRWDGRNVVLVSSLPVVSTVSTMLVRGPPSEPEPSLWFAFDFPAFLRGMPASGIVRATGCSQPGVPFCGGDSSSPACPCLNTGSAGRGCQNSALEGGALLSSSGRASLADDTLVLLTSDETRNSISIVWQASADGAAQRFGDGLTCIGGASLRMFKQRAVGGSIAVPGPHDASISAKSALLGDVLVPGARRIYEVRYRDFVAAFCPPPNGASFNASNALSVYWHP